MSASVVQIGDFRLMREQLREAQGCAHKRLSMNDSDEIVMCEDCGRQVGAYAALRTLVDYWSQLEERATRRQAELAQIAEKTVVLRAAQRVEKAWRSRTMLPTCPHCSEPIGPKDGFGTSKIDARVAQRRKDAARAAAERQEAHDKQTKDATNGNHNPHRT